MVTNKAVYNLSKSSTFLYILRILNKFLYLYKVSKERFLVQKFKQLPSVKWAQNLFYMYQMNMIIDILLSTKEILL